LQFRTAAILTALAIALAPSAQVLVESRLGAGGIVAASVLSAQPDGYTLFVFSSAIALSKSLLKFILLLLLKADSPLHTLKDARSMPPAPIRQNSPSARSIQARRRTSRASCCARPAAFPQPACRSGPRRKC